MTYRARTRVQRNLWVVAGAGLLLSAVGCNCDEGSPIRRLAPEIAVYDPAGDRGVDLTDLSFGEVPLGATKQLAVGVANPGTDKLVVCLKDNSSTKCTDVSRIQPDTAPFSVQFDNPDGDGNWAVDDGADREFVVSFTPVEEGQVAASLILVHNATERTTTINLNGNGVAPNVAFSTDTIDFGQVTVDQRKGVVLTLTNGTQFVQPITIGPMMQSAWTFGVLDVYGAEVPVDGTYTSELAGNSSLDIVVFFRPPTEGPHMNTMMVQFCPTCTQPITLRGEGIKPLFELVPDLLDFGTVEEATQVSDAFRIRNIGNVPLTVFNVALEQGTTQEYSIAPQAAIPAVIDPQQEISVAVTYVGTSPGEDQGRVEVITNAWDDPNTMVNETTGYVSLRAVARGPEIDAFPPVVNFGTVAIESNAARTLAILNSGNAPLTISDIQFAPSTGELTISGIPAFPLVVQPGTSVDLSLSYHPTDAGQDTATVSVMSDDRDEPTLTVPVNGVGGVPTTCSVNVAPAQLTFGLVERGRVAQLPVEIRNAGAQPCTVSNIALNGAAEFSITSGNGANVTVQPGANHVVGIAYAPTAYGTHNTVLSFNSDDPGQTTVQVPVSGSSLQSDVLVIPSSLDFAVVPVTCRSPVRDVIIYNTGNSVVTVTNVYLDPTTTPEFELTPLSTPYTLAAGAQVTVNVRYHPTDIGTDNGVLFIAHSAAPVPVAVPLSGEGRVNPTVTDVFSQLPTPQADVLFVVDNSCSMSEEQSNLGSNLTSFLAFAQSQGIDYQIAVTTTDVTSSGEQGRFVERGGTRIITPQTANASQVFRTNVTLGTNGSGTERGLEAAYLALSDPLINTWNAGFLRQDAALAVIFVSDETDQSTRAVSFYENFLRNIKGFQNSAMFSASSVVGITNPRCTSVNGDADYAPRYISIANNTGGVVESICAANWGQTLANIGLNSFGLRRQFTLSSRPVPVTIAVTVNGNAIPNTTAGGQVNWTYDSATNSVSFSAGSVPPAGSTISVTYAVACLS
ncbi:MAG: choice-of-anchor D domain-containing protein [Myxococcales bacterium]|nr:choice-of-anchor D domain-containing protein [Myxococcales bacterium]